MRRRFNSPLGWRIFEDGVEPEERLWVAIIRSAIEDCAAFVNSPTLKGQELFVSAFEWLFGDEGKEGYPLRFSDACDSLGVEPTSIRDKAADRLGFNVEAIRAELHSRGTSCRGGEVSWDDG